VFLTGLLAGNPDVPLWMLCVLFALVVASVYVWIQWMLSGEKLLKCRQDLIEIQHKIICTLRGLPPSEKP